MLDKSQLMQASILPPRGEETCLLCDFSIEVSQAVLSPFPSVHGIIFRLLAKREINKSRHRRLLTKSFCVMFQPRSRILSHVSWGHVYDSWQVHAHGSRFMVSCSCSWITFHGVMFMIHVKFMFMDHVSCLMLMDHVSGLMPMIHVSWSHVHDSKSEDMQARDPGSVGLLRCSGFASTFPFPSEQEP